MSASNQVRNVGIACLVLMLCSTPAHPETLQQALASAYRSNPGLQAERKRLEATDEQVPQAMSGFRPRVVARASALREHRRTTAQSGAQSALNNSGLLTPHGYQIDLSQSLFRGFRTVNAIKRADANVLAARQTLRETEQSTLLDAVTAYMNVIRDRHLSIIRRNDVRVLTTELRSIKTQFRNGDATRTDVAQTQGRRARSISALDLAKSNLRSSLSAYRRVVGHAPERLVEPPMRVAQLPKSLSAAIESAQSESPGVLRAAFLELSARHEIDILRGELLPEVNLEGRYDNQLDASLTTDRLETASIGARLTVPLYQGGEVFARIRAAKRTHESLIREIDQARVTARSNVEVAWSQLSSARARFKSAQIEVQANQIALNGVRAEERLGQRTLLDVLDAKQELLVARGGLISTKRDIVVASYNVLAAIGQLNASDANLNVVVHEPEVYHELVRPKFWGATVIANEDYVGYGVTD